MSDPAVLSDEQALAIIIRVADNLAAEVDQLKADLGATYNVWSKLRAAQAKLAAAEAEAGCSYHELTTRRTAWQTALAKKQAAHASQLEAVREWKARLKPKSKTD